MGTGGDVSLTRPQLLSVCAPQRVVPLMRGFWMNDDRNSDVCCGFGYRFELLVQGSERRELLVLSSVKAQMSLSSIVSRYFEHNSTCLPESIGRNCLQLRHTGCHRILYSNN